MIKEVNIQSGDVIVALASHGTTKYETTYNAGMGSNGLTSARHDLLSKKYLTKYPESFDSGTDQEVIYSGPFDLLDQPEDLPINIGKAILSPTRTFAPLFAKLSEKELANINGIIHCTGGGQTKVMKFCDKVHIIKDNLMPIPPLFMHIQTASGSSWKEMFEVFNMGHRMEFYMPESSDVKGLIALAHELGIEAQVIGRVEKASTKKLTIVHNNEVLNW